MAILRMSLFEHAEAGNRRLRLDESHNAVFVTAGRLSVGEEIVGADQAIHVGAQPVDVLETASFLRFALAPGERAPAAASGRLLLSETFDWPGAEGLFRLDQVTFGPGVRAYRHVHAGAGIRHLVKGRLELDAEGHATDMDCGSSWFEDRDSPVQATAAMDEELTRFVRAMVVPADYRNRPTIRFVNAEDEKRPRLQETHRFFEEPVSFAGQ